MLLIVLHLGINRKQFDFKWQEIRNVDGKK